MFDFHTNNREVAMPTVTSVNQFTTRVDDGWVVIEMEGKKEVVRLRTTPVMAKLLAEQLGKTADEAYLKQRDKIATGF